MKKEFALEQPIALPTYTTKTVLGEDDVSNKVNLYHSINLCILVE